MKQVQKAYTHTTLNVLNVKLNYTRSTQQARVGGMLFQTRLCKRDLVLRDNFVIDLNGVDFGVDLIEIEKNSSKSQPKPEK